MSRARSFAVALAAMIPAVSASAQQLPFVLERTIGSETSVIENRASIVLSAAAGATQTARIRATYTGSGQVTIPQQPVLTGSTAFTALLGGPAPVTLQRGGSFSFEVRFAPAGATQSAALLSLGFSDSIAGQGAIELALQGSASSIVMSYTSPVDQNAVLLSDGATIAFPATPLKTTAQLSLSFTNRGSGTGSVAGVSISGAAFSLSGLPLLPAQLAPGQTLQVSVLYRPSALQEDTGEIRASFQGAPALTVWLHGSGSAPGIVYQTLAPDSQQTITPGGVINLPDTPVGEPGSLIVRIANSGNASGVVQSISVAGSQFQLTGTPALPLTLAPEASATFTILFVPSRAGTANGVLTIGSDSFNLRGVGLGAQISLSYTAGGETIPVFENSSSVVFSPVMISQSAEIAFQVRNSGTLAATIANIGVGQVNGPYSLSGLPALPARLEPGASIPFMVRFAPTGLGFANGTLQIDTISIPLLGSGTQPPPLPEYRFTGSSGAVAAGSQPVIGLQLAEPYPVAIAGAVRMEVSGDLTPDPAVQFSSGGRTIAFVIPANSVDAVFGSSGTQLRLQTGTVAGTITLTPSFTTQAGGVDLNPPAPPLLQLSVAAGAPVVTAVQLSTPASNALLIRVTGYATSRSLSGWDLQFTTASGYQMPSSAFTIDVQQVASNWFRSESSRAFGGQFVLAIQFHFHGLPSEGAGLAGSIESVAVSLRNELGASAPARTKVP